MKSKPHARYTLDKFIHEISVPAELLTDGTKELTLEQWNKTCLKHCIHLVCTEPRSPWQNHAERMGGIITHRVRHRMRVTSTPIRLWDYYWEYIAALTSLTAANHPFLDDATP